MSDLNNVSLTGRLTKDATMKTVGAKGSSLVSFSIANNTGFGQYEKTNFFNVQIWGKAGEAVVQYLTKGKQVAVSGMFENAKWTGNDGISHDNWTLTANTVTLLSSPVQRKDDLQPATEAPSYSEVSAEDTVF